MRRWALKRQLVGVGIFAVLVFFVVGGIIYFFLPAPSCFDGRQNGEEEGIDCGGECKPCLGERPQDPRFLWARFFEISEGIYDLAAFIENTNILAGTSKLDYVFRLYDKDDVVITLKRGTVSLMPRESLLIFEPNIGVPNRIPAKVSFEIQSLAWERLPEINLEISVARKQFNLLPKPEVRATLHNTSLFEVKNIKASVLLYDAEDNIFAVSSTFVDSIEGEGKRDISFSWPPGFMSMEPARIDILLNPSL